MMHGAQQRPSVDSAIARARVAVLVPCYNEGLTIGDVVDKFRRALPAAEIHVYDNNSTDDTAEVARTHGALVSSESHQGKGHVIRRMFADIEADVYIMVDGDDTYDAAAAPGLVATLLRDRLDLLNGARETTQQAAYRPGHRFGNKVLSGMVQAVFGRQISDMLSGYKLFSRRFVKSFPAMSHGFEIETELVIHALELRMPCAEVPTRYAERPEGSASKLRTYRDGWRILRLIAKLIKEERPLPFFGWLGLGSIAVGILLAVPIVLEWLETGLVPRFPTAMLSTALVLLGVSCIFSGIVLDMVTRSRQEMKRLAYLAVPGLDASFARMDDRRN